MVYYKHKVTKNVGYVVCVMQGGEWCRLQLINSTTYIEVPMHELEIIELYEFKSND